MKTQMLFFCLIMYQIMECVFSLTKQITSLNIRENPSILCFIIWVFFVWGVLFDWNCWCYLGCQQCTWDGSSATVRDYVMFDNYFAFTLFFFGPLEWDWIRRIIYIYIYCYIVCPFIYIISWWNFFVLLLTCENFISDCSA